MFEIGVIVKDTKTTFTMGVYADTEKEALKKAKKLTPNEGEGLIFYPLWAGGKKG